VSVPRRPVPARAPLHISMPAPAPVQTPVLATGLSLAQSTAPSSDGTQDVTEGIDSLPPRTPLTSSLRVPRDVSAGRLVRRNVSGSVASSGGSRPLRFARSATGSAPTSQSNIHSESSSATGISRATNSPAEGTASNAELVRQGQKQLELKEMEVTANVHASEAAVKENARVNDLTMHLMNATFQVTHQEIQQRMELERQRIKLEEQQVELERQRVGLQLEHMALQSVATQMSMISQPRLPSVIMGSHNEHTQSGNYPPPRL
jgi:hypothetical protein